MLLFRATQKKTGNSSLAQEESRMSQQNNVGSGEFGFVKMQNVE